jgi:hypothetical protein
MTADEILTNLRGLGLTLELDGGRIMVGPSERLTDDVRGLIRGQRDEIVAALRQAELDRQFLARPPPLARVAWVIGDDAEEGAERIKAGIRRRSSAGAGGPVAGGGR